MFYICFYHLFITAYYTSCSKDSRPIYDCICIVFSLAFVRSCVCQLVLKNYDDDDDDDEDDGRSIRKVGAGQIKFVRESDRVRHYRERGGCRLTVAPRQSFLPFTRL